MKKTLLEIASSRFRSLKESLEIWKPLQNPPSFIQGKSNGSNFTRRELKNLQEKKKIKKQMGSVEPIPTRNHSNFVKISLEICESCLSDYRWAMDQGKRIRVWRNWNERMWNYDIIDPAYRVLTHIVSRKPDVGPHFHVMWLPILSPQG